MPDFAERVIGIGVLAEPVRRSLYEYVVAQADAVSREEAASGAGVPLHTAKFHLDRLADEGLLDVEYRRLTGRSGPGAGRPAKLYRRSQREVSVSLPERRYDLAGQILARAIERQAASSGPPDAMTTAREEARAEGRRLAAGAAGGPGDSGGSGDSGDAAAADAVLAVLADCGFEPRRGEDAMVLANCPFHSLAREHVELVCGMNLALVEGLLDGLDCEDLTAALEPETGLCCVKLRPTH